MWVLIVCHVLVSGYVQFWFVMLVIYESFHFFFPTWARSCVDE